MVSVEEAARIIKRGGLVVYPTETAYGLGADALNEEAVRELYRVKGRPWGKKLPVIVSSLEEVEGVSELGRFMSASFHPGPLNITVKHRLPWFGAFRISSSPVAARLAELCGPVTATSANTSGGPTPFSPEEVPFDLPLVDAGRLEKGPVSTVYDPDGRKIIREGAVPERELRGAEIAFDALKKVRPTGREESRALRLADEVMEVIKRHHGRVILGGSVAKGTFIKPLRDLDFFLLFREGDDLEEKLPLLEKIASELGKPEVEYSQHPYVSVEYRGVRVELVPAYDSKEVRSAADRSRWHVEWVSGLPEAVKDQIRVFKQFCKGIGMYGADLKVEGLSAYAMEVLVAGRGSFIKLLREVRGWKWPVRESDPVDEKRNVLASLSREKFELLREAAGEYLKAPGEEFFFPKAPGRADMSAVEVVELERPELPEDAVWGWAKRRARKLARSLKGHRIKDWVVVVGEKVWVVVRVEQVSEMEVEGPPVKLEEHAKRFRAAHGKVFEREGRLYAVEKVAPLGEQVNLVEDKEGWFSRHGNPEVARFTLGLRPWEH